MAERNAQFLQISFGHIGQDLEIDGILDKDGCVLGEADPIKPSQLSGHWRSRSRALPSHEIILLFLQVRPTATVKIGCASLDHLVGAGAQRRRHFEA